MYNVAFVVGRLAGFLAFLPCYIFPSYSAWLVKKVGTPDEFEAWANSDHWTARRWRTR